jgi:hypothetical protein
VANEQPHHIELELGSRVWPARVSTMPLHVALVFRLDEQPPLRVRPPLERDHRHAPTQSERQQPITERQQRVNVQERHPPAA